MTTANSRKSPDWKALHELFLKLVQLRAEEVLVQVVNDELPAEALAGVRPSWAASFDYLDALQRSIEGADDEPLIEMLQVGLPIHPILLPLVAERLLRKSIGVVGRPKKLTYADEKRIAEAAAAIAVATKANIEEIDKVVAQLHGVSAKMVQRIRLKTQPPTS